MTKKCPDCGRPIEDRFPRCRDCEQKRKSILPDKYLELGYFDPKGNLFEQLVTDHAQAIAEILEANAMKSASLRRFFGMVKATQRKLEASDDFGAVVPEILALKPYVSNAVTRGVVPVVFQRFIDRNVDKAKVNQKAFEQGFVKHFEYVVAFFPRN